MNHRSTSDRSTQDCPDPETLAAWVDEGLRGDERSRVEHHAAGCARCQAHLAAMTRLAAVDQAVEEPRPARPFWQWLVPAAAGVTAVALWILMVPTPPPVPSPVASSVPSSVPSSEPASAPPAAPLEDRGARTEGAPLPSDLDARIVDEKSRNRAVVKPRADVQEQTTAARKESPSPAPAEIASESASMTYLGVLPIEITSPDPSIRWRLTRSVIERSTNAGATWQPQHLGIAEHLTAGVAPSTSVVWVVGQRGVVLLTTDGLTWRRLSPPASVDLVGVQATNATHATVTTFDGRTFSTSDGITWVQR